MINLHETSAASLINEEMFWNILIVGYASAFHGRNTIDIYVGYEVGNFYPANRYKLDVNVTYQVNKFKSKN